MWPLALYFGLAVFIAMAMLVLSWILGGRHKERATEEPYESGMLPTGSAHVRFPSKYFLVAVFFVIFDLESVFLYAWAVSLRQTGWAGYIEAVIFIGVLMATLVYLWRVGALDWGTSGRKMQRKAGGREHDFRS